MQIFLLLLCTSAFFGLSQCLTAEQFEYFTQIFGECGISNDATNKALAGEFPEDQQFKAGVLCVTRKLGLQDEDGQLKMELITDMLHRIIPEKDKVDDILSRCMVQLATPEESAYEAMKCIHQVKHS